MSRGWPTGAIVAVLWAVCSVSAANAASVTVSTTADVSNGDVSNVGALVANPGPDGISLREAFAATNNTPGGATIEISTELSGETVALQNVLPPLTRPFTSVVGPRDGAGDPQVTIDSQNITTGWATVTLAASYIVIRGLHFTGSDSLPGASVPIAVPAGDSVYLPNGPSELRGARIVDNLFDKDPDSGDIDAGLLVGTQHVQTPGAISDVVIARNSFDAAGMNVEAQSGMTIDDVTIAENSFSGFGPGAVEVVASGDDVTVANTRITGNEFRDGQLPIWIGLGSWAGHTSGSLIDDTAIDRNLFHNNASPALDMAGGDDTVAGTGAGTTDNTISDTQFANNLVSEGQDPNEVLIIGGRNGAEDNAIDGVQVVNDTLTNSTGGVAVTAISNGPGGTGNAVTGVTVRNTVFDGSGNDFGSGTPEVTPAQVDHSITCTSGYAGANGNLCADPLFADEANGDFHLQAGSPAIDAGSSESAPGADLECRARHDDPATTNTGGGTSPFYDIGAFEFGGSGSCAPIDTEPPASPSNLSATRGSITLEWDNPADADFAGVVVRMSQGQAAPETPEEGDPVYEGTADSALVEGVSDCESYSFSVFAHDTFPNFAPAATTTVPALDDTDGDGHGDDCDPDDDGDGVLDGADACPQGETGWTSGSGTDHDADGCRDAGEDTDDDDDGVTDGADACPTGETGWTSGPLTDHDADGCKDSSEDPDDDNDGVADPTDACPTGQALGPDLDGDGCKNGPEDSDDDGDLVADDRDHCELIPGIPSTGCPRADRALSLRYRRRAGVFKGRLSSVELRCIAGQVVAVFKRVRGRDRRVGKDETDDGGRFRVAKRRRRGRFYAAVEERTIDDLATCAGASSPIRRLRGARRR